MGNATPAVPSGLSPPARPSRAQPTTGPSPALSLAELTRLRDRLNAEYAKYLWYTVLGVIGLLALRFWLVRAWRKFSRTTGIPTAVPERRPPNPHGPIAVRRLPVAVSNAFRIVFFRWTLPLTHATLADATFTLGYLALLLLITFVDTRNLNLVLWASRAGLAAGSQMALMPVLASKNNIISVLTGIPHEKMVYLHRAAGRSMVLLLWIHASGKYYGGTRFIFIQFVMGGVALLALTAAFLLSLRPLRTLVYEFFLVTHIILIAVFMVAAWYHVEHVHKTGYWIWSAMALWAFDRVFRLLRVILNARPWSSNGSTLAMIEIISEDTTRVTMQRPMSWKAGQHAFLTFPGISTNPLEAHPFTIATIPDPPRRRGQSESDSQELIFIIRGRNGFTGRLRRQAQNAREGSKNIVTAFIDGPYGSPPDLTTYSTAILIAGGSGVSYTISMFEHLIQRARKGTSNVARIVFMWTIRDEAHISWIYDQLVSTLACAPESVSVSVQIFVTRAKSQMNGLPSDDSTTDPEEVNSEKAFLLSLPAVRVTAGRPDIHGILAAEVGASYGSVSVDVSGPTPLIASVRAATRSSDIAGPDGIARGMPSISLHAEEFSM